MLLSFDGTPKAQTLRGRGTFAVLDRRLEELRRDHPGFLRRSLTVGITLTPSMVGGLADAIHYLTGKGVRRITVSPVVAANPDWSAERHRELEVQFDRILELSVGLYNVSGEVPVAGFRRSSNPPVPRKSRGARNRSGRVPVPNEGAMCGAGRGEEITVDPDGEVSGCPIWLESLQEFPGESSAAPFRSAPLGTYRFRRARGSPRRSPWRGRGGRHVQSTREEALFIRSLRRLPIPARLRWSARSRSGTCPATAIPTGFPISTVPTAGSRSRRARSSSIGSRARAAHDEKE